LSVLCFRSTEFSSGRAQANTPGQDPAKFELVINIKAAKTLGLTIPESDLLRADQVIE